MRYFPICEPCIRGEGSECHTSECALFLRDVPSDGVVEAFATDPDDDYERGRADGRAEVVKAIEAELDDADQVTDRPTRANSIAVWGVRRVLVPFGGKPHRWPFPPSCVECRHDTDEHQWEGCSECDCMLSVTEAIEGRDESIDNTIQQARWEDAVIDGEPWIDPS